MNAAKHQPMDKNAAAARIQYAAARHPESPTAQTEFDRRAQSAADQQRARDADEDVDED